MDDTRTPPRHRDDTIVPETDRPRSTRWRSAWLWAGRSLLVLTAVAVVLTRVTRAQWSADGYDSEGFAVSWLPNVTLVLVLAVGITWPWVSGLAASTNACWRDGDTVVGPTVLGRRRIRVQDALVLAFRVPSHTGTVHGAVVVDRRLRVLAIVDPVASGLRGRLNRLTGRSAPGTVLRAVAEYALGLLWLVSTVVVVVGLVVLVDAFTGALGRY